MNSCLYECHVMHARFKPRAHRFLYRIFLFAIDLDELEMLPRRVALFSLGRRNAYSFRDGDFLPVGEALHNGGSAGVPPASSSAGGTPALPRKLALPLKQRLTAHAARHGVDIAGGRVMLVTLPRVFGFLFNPVSFYFCYDRHGVPAAAIAEVTNTFREVKPYFLGPECWSQETGDRGQWTGDRRQETQQQETGGSDPVPCPPSPVACPLSTVLAPLSTVPRPPSPVPRPPSSVSRPPSSGTFRLRVPKHFYVSPYSDVDVAFDFVLRTPGTRLTVQIDDYAGGERTLTSTLTGARRELTSARLAWYTFKYPLITLRVVGLIHWHALRLWWKRVPWFAKSARAADQRALYRPHHSLQPSDAA